MTRRLSEIEVFLAIATSGGITAAARQLGLGKSAVSKQLAALEERLAVRLVARNTRSLSLTPDGRAFAERATAALDSLREAEESVAAEPARLRGHLRLSLPMSFGVHFLAEPLAAFLHAHPEVDVQLDLTDRKVDMVEEGYDLAVRGGRMISSALVARRLAPFQVFAAASPVFLAKHGPLLEPADLLRCPGVLYRQTDTPNVIPLSHRDGRTTLISPDSRIRSDNGDIMVELAVRGHGWVLLPDFLLAEPVRRGLLVPVLPGWLGPEGAMWTVLPNRRHLPTRVKAIAQAFLDALRDPPWSDVTRLVTTDQ